MSLYVGGMQQEVVQVRQHPVHVQAVDQALDDPTIFGPSILETKRHAFEHKQPEVANECREALAARGHGDVVVGLGGVQGGEHLGPRQAFQHLGDPRGGKRIRNGEHVKGPVVHGPAGGPVLL